MKSAIKSLILSLTLICSFTQARYDFGIANYEHEAIAALTIAARDYNESDLPEATRTIYATIASSTGVDLKTLSNQAITNLVKSLSAETIKKAFACLSKDDKKIILEGVFVQYIDKDNTDNFKKFVELILFVIVAGNEFDATLTDILFKHKKELDELKSIKRGLLSNDLIIRNKLKSIFAKLNTAIPTAIKEEVEGNVNKRKSRFVKNDNDLKKLESMIIDITKKKLSLN